MTAAAVAPTVIAGPGKWVRSLAVIIPKAILPNSSGLYGSAASDDSRWGRTVQAQLRGRTDSRLHSDDCARARPVHAMQWQNKVHVSERRD